MAIGSVRFELNSAGIRSLLGSEGVKLDLRARADRVAAAATERAPEVGWEDEREPLPIEVVDASSSSRARVLVRSNHYAGLAVESKYRLLGGALDAARG